MLEEMLFSIRQKFKQFTADAYMTFQGTRGARHVIQPWQKHHFFAKKFMRKIHKKGIYTSILDRFQNDEVLHASQLQHNWSKEWCENIWMTSEQSIFRTKPLQNKWNDTQRCIIFGTIRNRWREDPIKNRPDYHQTTRTIVSMNKAAGQIQESKRRHNYHDYLDTEKLHWLYMALSQLEMVLRGKPNLRFKFHTTASPKISRSACFGKPRSIH